jgi:hypothetical protein
LAEEAKGRELAYEEAARRGRPLLVAGATSRGIARRVARDSLVNDVLRSGRWPVMVCR